MEFITKQAIAEALKNYMETHTISQSDVAKKSDVRKEYISNILKPDSNFTYDAGRKGIGYIPAKYFYQIADLIGFQVDKTFWEIKPTEQMSAILAHLNDAKQFGYTNVIIGETGSGKSFVKDLFLKKNPADVFSINVGSSDNLADLLDKILDVLKIPAARTKSKKLRDIAKKLRDLKNDGYLPVLILDESEYMKQPALCAMKELYDALYQHCAIILFGTDQLITNLESLKRRNKPGIPQFYRRIKFGIRILPNIDRSFDMFLDGIEDKGLVRMLRRICDNYGELHDVLVPALRESDRTGEPLTEHFVRKVLNISDSMAA